MKRPQIKINAHTMR